MPDGSGVVGGVLGVRAGFSQNASPLTTSVNFAPMARGQSSVTSMQSLVFGQYGGYGSRSYLGGQNSFVFEAESDLKQDSPTESKPLSKADAKNRENVEQNIKQRTLAIDSLRANLSKDMAAITQKTAEGIAEIDRKGAQAFEDSKALHEAAEKQKEDSTSRVRDLAQEEEKLEGEIERMSQELKGLSGAKGAEEWNEIAGRIEQLQREVEVFSAKDSAGKLRVLKTKEEEKKKKLEDELVIETAKLQELENSEDVGKALEKTREISALQERFVDVGNEKNSETQKILQAEASMNAANAMAFYAQSGIDDAKMELVGFAEAEMATHSTQTAKAIRAVNALDPTVPSQEFEDKLGVASASGSVDFAVAKKRIEAERKKAHENFDDAVEVVGMVGGLLTKSIHQVGSLLEKIPLVGPILAIVPRLVEMMMSIGGSLIEKGISDRIDKTYDQKEKDMGKSLAAKQVKQQELIPVTKKELMARRARIKDLTINLSKDLKRGLNQSKLKAEKSKLATKPRTASLSIGKDSKVGPAVVPERSAAADLASYAKQTTNFDNFVAKTTSSTDGVAVASGAKPKITTDKVVEARKENVALVGTINENVAKKDAVGLSNDSVVNSAANHDNVPTADSVALASVVQSADAISENLGDRDLDEVDAADIAAMSDASPSQDTAAAIANAGDKEVDPNAPKESNAASLQSGTMAAGAEAKENSTEQTKTPNTNEVEKSSLSDLSKDTIDTISLGGVGDEGNLDNKNAAAKESISPDSEMQNINRSSIGLSDSPPATQYSETNIMQKSSAENDFTALAKDKELVDGGPSDALNNIAAQSNDMAGQISEVNPAKEMAADASELPIDGRDSAAKNATNVAEPDAGVSVGDVVLEGISMQENSAAQSAVNAFAADQYVSDVTEKANTQKDTITESQSLTNTKEAEEIGAEVADLKTKSSPEKSNGESALHVDENIVVASEQKSSAAVDVVENQDLDPYELADTFMANEDDGLRGVKESNDVRTAQVSEMEIDDIGKTTDLAAQIQPSPRTEGVGMTRNANYGADSFAQKNEYGDKGSTEDLKKEDYASAADYGQKQYDLLNRLETFRQQQLKNIDEDFGQEAVSDGNAAKGADSEKKDKDKPKDANQDTNENVKEGAAPETDSKEGGLQGATSGVLSQSGGGIADHSADNVDAGGSIGGGVDNGFGITSINNSMISGSSDAPLSQEKPSAPANLGGTGGEQQLASQAGGVLGGIMDGIKNAVSVDSDKDKTSEVENEKAKDGENKGNDKSEDGLVVDEDSDINYTYSTRIPISAINQPTETTTLNVQEPLVDSEIGVGKEAELSTAAVNSVGQQVGGAEDLIVEQNEIDGAVLGDNSALQNSTTAIPEMEILSAENVVGYGSETDKINSTSLDSGVAMAATESDGISISENAYSVGDNVSGVNFDQAKNVNAEDIAADQGGIKDVDDFEPEDDAKSEPRVQDLKSNQTAEVAAAEDDIPEDPSLNSSDYAEEVVEENIVNDESPDIAPRPLTPAELGVDELPNKIVAAEVSTSENLTANGVKVEDNLEIPELQNQIDRDVDAASTAPQSNTARSDLDAALELQPESRSTKEMESEIKLGDVLTSDGLQADRDLSQIDPVEVDVLSVDKQKIDELQQESKVDELSVSAALQQGSLEIKQDSAEIEGGEVSANKISEMQNDSTDIASTSESASQKSSSSIKKIEVTPAAERLNVVTASRVSLVQDNFSSNVNQPSPNLNQPSTTFSSDVIGDLKFTSEPESLLKMTEEATPEENISTAEIKEFAPTIPSNEVNIDRPPSPKSAFGLEDDLEVQDQDIQEIQSQAEIESSVPLVPDTQQLRRVSDPASYSSTSDGSSEDVDEESIPEVPIVAASSKNIGIKNLSVAENLTIPSQPKNAFELTSSRTDSGLKPKGKTDIEKSNIITPKSQLKYSDKLSLASSAIVIKGRENLQQRNKDLKRGLSESVYGKDGNTDLANKKQFEVALLDSYCAKSAQIKEQCKNTAFSNLLSAESPLKLNAEGKQCLQAFLDSGMTDGAASGVKAALGNALLAADREKNKDSSAKTAGHVKTDEKPTLLGLINQLPTNTVEESQYKTTITNLAKQIGSAVNAKKSFERNAEAIASVNPLDENGSMKSCQQLKSELQEKIKTKIEHENSNKDVTDQKLQKNIAKEFDNIADIAVAADGVDLKAIYAKFQNKAHDKVQQQSSESTMHHSAIDTKGAKTAKDANGKDLQTTQRPQTASAKASVAPSVASGNKPKNEKDPRDEKMAALLKSANLDPTKLSDHVSGAAKIDSHDSKRATTAGIQRRENSAMRAG